MIVRVTVEVFGDDGVVTPESNQEKAIAEGRIIGDLVLGAKTEGKPILTVRMRNILAAVQETINRDSNA